MKVDNDALMEKIVECWNHVNETTLLDAALMFRGEMSVIDKHRSSIGGVCHKEYLYYGNRSTTCSHSETLDVVDEHIVFRFGNRIKQSLHKTKDAHRRHNMLCVWWINLSGSQGKTELKFHSLMGTMELDTFVKDIAVDLSMFCFFRVCLGWMLGCLSK